MKLFNRILGFKTNRDEYQKEVIFNIIGETSIILWCISMVYMFIRLLVISYVSFDLIFIAILNTLFALVLTIRLRVSGSDIEEIYSTTEFNQIKRKLKYQGVFMGVYWGLFMFLVMGFIDFLDETVFNLSFFDFLIWQIGGAAFGLLMYLLSLSKLKIVK